MSREGFLKLENFLKYFFWFSVIFLYFLPVHYYIFLLDIIVLLVLGLKIINEEKISLNKNFLIIFSIFFIGVSLLLPFYNPIYPPFVFISLLYFVFLFILSGFNYESLKPILLILPFVAIPYSLLKKQSEFSFIYKNNSILGFLLILGFVFFRKNKILSTIFLFSIFLTFSKTSYLALFLILIYFLLKISGKRKKVIALVFIPILIILIFLFYRAALNEPFFGSRIKIWKTAIKTGLYNLPTGVGGFNFNFYSDEFKEVEKTNIDENFDFYKKYLKDRVNLKVYNFKRVRFEHNLYLKLFAEYGFLGFILSAFLLYILFIIFRKGSGEEKFLTIIFLIFSSLQNFSLNYIFLFPFIVFIVNSFKYKFFEVKREAVVLSMIFYFFLFSLPLFLNEISISNNKYSFSKRVIPFDYRADCINFNRGFEELKNNSTIKNLYSLKRYGELCISKNRRLKEVYSMLSFSFYSFINNRNENKFIKKEAFAYTNRWILLDPNNPIALTHLAKLYYKVGKINKAKEELFEALRVEPFYLEALKTLKSVYKNSSEYENQLLISEVIKKIVKDREKYNFRGSSLYEKIIIGKFR